MNYQHPVGDFQQVRTDERQSGNWGVGSMEPYGRGYPSTAFPPILRPEVAYRVPGDCQNGVIVYPAPVPYYNTEPTATQLPLTGQGSHHTYQPQFQHPNENGSSMRREENENRRRGELHMGSHRKLGKSSEASEPKKSPKGTIQFVRYDTVHRRQKCRQCKDHSYQCNENSTYCSVCLERNTMCEQTEQDKSVDKQKELKDAELGTPGRSPVQGQPQPEETSDCKVGNTNINPPENYEERNSTARPSGDQAESLSNDLGLRIRLIWSRLKNPPVILNLIQNHKVYTLDAFKDYYELVFSSLSDTQSSRLLKLWLHALSDGANFQYNSFCWNSHIVFNEHHVQDPNDRKKLLQHMACGNHGVDQAMVMNKLQACLREERINTSSLRSVEEVLVLRMVELLCRQVNVRQ